MKFRHVCDGGRDELLNHDERRSPVWPELGQLNPEDAVPHPKPRTFPLAADNADLVPWRKVLGDELGSGGEQDRDEIAN